MTKLAIITTHPIQYYAPVFKKLAQLNHVQVRVFYTWGEEAIKSKYDPGFKKQVEWDIPLLDGYDYTFVKNTSSSPGSHHFKGIMNPTLVQDIINWKANALLVFGWSYQSHLKVLRHFKGKIPIYFRGDSHLLDEQPGVKKHLRRFLLKWVYHHIDYAFYVGSENRKYFFRHGLKEQLIFAPHAIDNQRFADTDGQYACKAKAWRQQLGIAENQIVILFAGKFEHKKNPLLLLRVAEHFKESNQFAFVFAGNGPMEKQIKEKAKNFSNVHFVDFQNQSCMPVLYRLCDIFVLPSQGPGETWGLAVNEAMACGKPVLVSNKVGCAIDLVIPGQNGYIFHSNSIQDLENKLLLMGADKQKLADMGKKSTQIIQNWSFGRQLSAFEDSFNIKINV